MLETSHLRADLGPTNTGKTHHAIARMLQFRSGVIGLPLRLLAREVYDKICAMRDPSEVALITGEERIIGAKSRYWVATVEAMPMDFDAEIVIIDEIQLAADPERGHIFTDRLLHARGSKETLFLGSHAMRPMMQKLFRNCHIESRPRLSQLSWIGRKKLSNLPPRSAIVAFSAEEVYATAEFLRRQHGGAAVVMGALSPRTRNAQVELYQNGEVDYIVATDAIGMGLNLDIDQVFFAGTEKFDGRRKRALFPHELAQIAGRAGRFSKNGGFGITANAADFSPDTIKAIEGHHFSPINQLEWRNSALNFNSIDALLTSLETPPDEAAFSRAREADDLRVLRNLAKREDIRALIHHPSHVELLWSVCQLPDFPKFAAGEHLTLCDSLFSQLRSKSGHISEETISKAVNLLAQPHHNIEILARKLAQIRTWAYIAQRNHWLKDAKAWRERTRQVEDELSDALHNALMQSFIDTRTSKLRRRLKEKEKLMANVNTEGEVTINGEFAGRLNGFRFEIDPKAAGEEAKTIAAAAREALAPVFHLRCEKFYNATDQEITLSNTGAVIWEDAAIGRLKKGSDILAPEVEPFLDENIASDLAEKIKRRLSHWLERRQAELLAPLFAIKNDETLTGLVKGVGFQLVEALGVIPRMKIAQDIKNLSQDDRAFLRKHGVRFGQYSIFIPAVLKPAPTEFRLTLSSLWQDEGEIPAPPPAGLVTIPANENYKPHHYALAGYHLAGARAIRIDMLERLADLLRDVDRSGFEANPDMLSITGLSLEQLADMLANLGYQGERGERERVRPEGAPTPETPEGGEAEPEIEIFYSFRAKPRNQGKPKGKKPQGKKGKKQGNPNFSAKPRKADKPIDPDNPFAALMALKEKS